LTESEPAGITQKDNLIRKVIHIAAWNVPEKDIWMPFLGIPARRGERRPHPPNFPVCVRISEIADRLGVENPLSRHDIQSFGLCSVPYVSSRFFLRLSPSVGSI
jgi:hypothetical protein